MSKEKPTRGRLSSIDTLPEWADEAKIWAFGELKERRRSQLDILDEFNSRLRAAAFGQGITGDDVPQVSRSAFNRTALKLAILGRRLEETREIAAVLAPKLDQAGDNSVTLLVSETLKTLISEMLSNAGELRPDGETAEMLMMTARALQAAEQAKRISTDMRKRIEVELKEKAAAAVEKVAKMHGGTPESIAALKAAIGVQIKDRG